MNLNNRKYVLLILAGLFLTLILSSSLFHNHVPTLEEPFTCPVFLFQTVLSMAIISLFLAQIGIEKYEIFTSYHSVNIPKRIYYLNLSNRAPPKDLH
jgi:hypothetical protein